MENRRYRREPTHNYYEDETARRYPRRRIQTIRLLTEGAAETLLDQGRRRLNDMQFENDNDTFSRSWRRPPPRQQSSFIGIFPLLRKILFYGSLATFLLLVSIGEFGLVYILTMPGLHSNEILHFDYTGSGIANQVLGIEPPTMACDLQRQREGSCKYDNTTNPAFPTRITSLNSLQNYEIDQTYQLLWQTAPIAVVDLRANHDAWQHYHPDAIPALKRDERLLKQGAPHFVEVVLSLPESQMNLQKIGMFTVVVELRSENSKDNTSSELLASSTRTARMPHESNWISVVRKFFCIILHLSGGLPEQKTITVPAFRFFMETQDAPLRYISVRLLVSPEAARRGAMVEVTSGKVKIGEEPTGFSLLLKEWFFMCGVVLTTIFFVLQSLILLFLRLCCCKKRNQEYEEEYIVFDNASEGLVFDEMDGNNSDAMYENIHSDSSNNNNAEQQQRPTPVDYNDEDQWEDLPQETTQGDSQQDNSATWISDN